MPPVQPFANEIRSIRELFNRSTSVLEEENSDFAPRPEMMTVAQHVAHVAQTVDWFIEGAFVRTDGFDMDFEGHTRKVQSVKSLRAAREWFEKAIENAIRITESQSEEGLLSPLPPGLVMGGQPRLAIFAAMTDHTAHHRGALTVYSRLLGKTPKMPYMD